MINFWVKKALTLRCRHIGRYPYRMFWKMYGGDKFWSITQYGLGCLAPKYILVWRDVILTYVKIQCFNKWQYVWNLQPPLLHDSQLKWDVLLYQYFHLIRKRRRYPVIVLLYGLEDYMEPLRFFQVVMYSILFV
jgi:hypothetical protein